jgi:NTP pyrophosphatase (non-canonical NTP hydrolase)
MDFKTLEQKVAKNAFDYGKRHNIKFDQEFAVIKLMEEVGEFAQALLIHQKKCRESKFVSQDISKEELGKELADVIGMVIVNANLLGIDLEKAIDQKWIHKDK